MSETATVEIYSGHHDTIPEKDPFWSEELEVCSEWFGSRAPNDVALEADTVKFSDNIEFDSGPIEIWCEADIPVILCVHTNDSYHTPNEWGRPIEQGLPFGPDSDQIPFGCEVWGRVLIWVAEK